MSALWTLAVNGCREQFRSRFFFVSLLFGGVSLYMSVLLGVLAADQEVRVLLDFGLSAIELLLCAAVAFTAATGLLQEIEQRTVTLILTRPVSRSSYLLGRFLGTVLAAAAALAAMSALHLILLWAKGWTWSAAYPLAVWGTLLKVVMTAAIATLLALISTSVLSAVLMTSILWTLGHFMAEIRFLAARAEGAASGLLYPVIALLPDLGLLNYRDRFHAAANLTPDPLYLGVCYALAYSAACLALAVVLFRRREF
ncbi:MAG: hypothetical protein A2X36_01500 [Elusimicrobia bacterium GWA2_69_24]|nr:MAG: hypothetical protein A2X36_01500 [Elusimicrobia bacterium GWA2_69_24]